MEKAPEMSLIPNTRPLRIVKCSYCNHWRDEDDMCEFEGDEFCVICEPNMTSRCSECGERDFVEHIDEQGVCSICNEHKPTKGG